MKYLIILLFIMSSNNFFSQNLIGYVYDKNNNEIIIGATIVNNNKAAVTNNYGFYTLDIGFDTLLNLTIYSFGHQKLDTLVEISNDKSYNFYLSSKTSLREVEIIANNEEEKGQILSINEIKKIPTFFGESDVIKAFQFLPGVKQGAEGFGALLIRGGTADQVQYILDDMPLYYVNHLGGFTSVFNTDAINKAELFKNHFPANYSGRLSGFFDVRMKEGNSEKWNGNFTTGILSSKLNLNGPVIKNKSTLQVSLRTLNFNLITEPILKIAKAKVQPSYYFYDAMMKYTHQINTKNKLSVSFFNAYDKIKLYSYDNDDAENFGQSDFKYGWGSAAAAIRLLQVLRPRLFLSHVASGSIYQYNLNLDIKNKDADKLVKYNSINTLSLNLKNLILKSNAEYTPNNNLKINGGLSYELLISSLGNQSSKVISPQINTFEKYEGNKVQSNQFNAYLNADLNIDNKLKISIGANQLLFNSNQFTKTYFQPRLLISYLFSANKSMSFSYCKNVQALHLLSNNGVGMPTDIWVPANDYAKPQEAEQFNLNYTQYLKQKKYSVQGDLYYKTAKKLIRYKDAFNLFSQKNDWTSTIERNGKGVSYGLEILFKKETGKWTGFLSYTLSKTTNQFDNVNEGKPFNFRYDRRHELNLFISSELNKKINFNTVFYFATGNAITLPTSIYNIPKVKVFETQAYSYLYGYNLSEGNGDYNYVFNYNGVNNQRTSNFHRLDVSISIKKQLNHGLRAWSFGFYNLYNHHNPFAYYYNYDFGNAKFNLKSVSIFQIIPFFSYDYKF